MDDDYTLEDFENVICLKNQLICVPTKTLLEVYNDKENFIAFLDNFSVLANTDSAFMLFSEDMVQKVRDIIRNNRFKYKEKEIVTAMNEIILYLNNLQSYSQSYRNILMNGYLIYHEDCRKIEMEDTQIFLESMAYDAVVYWALKYNKMEEIERDDMFLASVNYIMEAMPEFFADLKVQALLFKKLDELERKKGFFKNKTTRIFAKETKENFQKIKAKGE